MATLDSMIRDYQMDAGNLRRKRQRTAEELLNRHHGRLESILTDVVDMIAVQRIQMQRRHDILDLANESGQWQTVNDRLQAIDED